MFAELGKKIPVRRVSYILKPEPSPFATFSSERRGHWLRAASVEPSLGIRPWIQGDRYPQSSLPPLLAGQAARRQGEGVSDIFHFALFRKFLVDNRDISDPKVLAEVAKGSGLDLDQFWTDYKDPTLREAVYAEHLEAVDLWQTEAVPTIIIGEERIEGAVTREVYRSALTKIQ